MITAIMFYDRREELDTLEAEWRADRWGFVVIYGRRRVGKTELIKRFCREKPHVYYLAAQESELRQRQKLVEQVANRFDDRVPRIDDWPDAFDYLAEKLAGESLIVAIDEFPYLIEENESVLSYTQALIDETGQETDSLLILCGSSVSVMESDVLGSESPLYGRRTARIDLLPFTFARARGVIGYDIEEAIRSYAVTGGMPLYLTLFDYSQELGENVREHVLSKTSILYNEPEFLLRTERLRNPARYMSVLEAIAAGRTTPNEISGATGIDPGPLSRYLRTLRQLRLIEREVPVTETKNASKRSVYRIGDPFLAFWFRFVEPNRSGIEEAPELMLDDVILPGLDRYTSKRFERIAAEAVVAASRSGDLEPTYPNVGRWWYNGEEIDVVGLNPREDAVLFGECKWQTSEVGYGVARRLAEKASEVRWRTGSRTEEYALFSKSGFEDGLKQRLDERWRLFDLEWFDAVFPPS
jgi:AAA+ ATPase superfamily predicted ATPase